MFCNTPEIQIRDDSLSFCNFMKFSKGINKIKRLDQTTRQVKNDFLIRREY